MVVVGAGVEYSDDDGRMRRTDMASADAGQEVGMGAGCSGDDGDFVSPTVRCLSPS